MRVQIDNEQIKIIIIEINIKYKLNKMHILKEIGSVQFFFLWYLPLVNRTRSPFFETSHLNYVEEYCSQCISRFCGKF